VGQEGSEALEKEKVLRFMFTFPHSLSPDYISQGYRPEREGKISLLPGGG